MAAYLLRTWLGRARPQYFLGVLDKLKLGAPSSNHAMHLLVLTVTLHGCKHRLLREGVENSHDSLKIAVTISLM